MRTRATTPFGRRPMTLAMMASQTSARDFTQSPSATYSPVHKWRLFRNVTEAKGELGVTDRALSVLHALLSFHQETALVVEEPQKRRDKTAESESRASGDHGLIVFPSNNELSLRAHGMAFATLRRHLACLVDAGLIIRRDSANGKRFARKGQGGEIDAFGFDLTPLVARATEIETLAEDVRAKKRAIALLRERITITRRDIVKMIEMAIEEGVPGDWQDCHLRYAGLAARYSRTLPRTDLEALALEIEALADEMRSRLEKHVKIQKMSANESQNERHIQNQNTNQSDLEPSLPEGRAATPGLKPIEKAVATVETPKDVPASPDGTQKAVPPRTYPLGMVLQACPEIFDYARGGQIANWADLRAAAAIVRPALGVSPDAWTQAIDVMGEHDASIVIAAILQRGDEIKSAGGYLRSLTAKARAGEFSLGPVLMALLRGGAAKTGRERKIAR